MANASGILSLTQLAKRENVHVSTAHRWHLKGVRGVKLETFMRGGVRHSTDEAVDRFYAAITASSGAMAGQSSQQAETALNALTKR